MGHVTTFYRVYARFGVIVGIALVILAAPALDRLIRRSRWGLAIGLCAPGSRRVRAAARARDVLGGRVEPARLRPLARRPAARHRRPLSAAHRPGAGNPPRRARDLLPDVPPPAALQHLRRRNRRYARRRDQDHEPLHHRPEHARDPRRRRRALRIVHDDVYREQGEDPPGVSEAFRPIRTFPNVRVFELRKDVQPVDLDALLEQQAVTVAGVQGLAVPELSFGAGFGPPSTRTSDRGWRRLDGDATFSAEARRSEPEARPDRRPGPRHARARASFVS